MLQVGQKAAGSIMEPAMEPVTRLQIAISKLHLTTVLITYSKKWWRIAMIPMIDMMNN